MKESTSQVRMETKLKAEAEEPYRLSSGVNFRNRKGDRNMNNRSKMVGLMTVCVLQAVFLVAGADGIVAAKMEDAWRQLETNLLHPKTEILSDACAADDGRPLRMERFLPRPEEIAKQFPNPCGWTTCTEDGVLHTVPYLLAALARHRALGDEASAALVRRLFRGLKRCVEIPGTGFLARNICPFDMQSFYWNCSRDQYTLWVYGMWRYARSPLASVADRRDIARLMTMVAKFHEACIVPENQYGSVRYDGRVGMVCRMWTDDPFKPPHFNRNGAGDVDGVRAHEILRLHEIYAATWSVTGDEHWWKRYEAIAEGGLRIAELPLDRNIDGFPSFQSQLSQRLLWEVDPDPVRKARYLRLLQRGTSLGDYVYEKGARTLQEIGWRTAVPCGDWRGWKMRMLGGKDWFSPGRFISGYAYLLPEWDPSFHATYDGVRNLGEGILVKMLCPGFKVPEALSKGFDDHVKRCDFARHCSAGLVYPLLVHWWRLSPE